MSPDKSLDVDGSSELKVLSKAGFRALEDKDIDGAEYNFQKILSLDASNCYAFVGLAECAKKRKDFDTAVQWYEKCLEHDPGNEVTIRGLFVCLSDTGNFQRVAEIWEKYIEVLQESNSNILKAADAFRKLKNSDMAAMLYENLLERDPVNRYALSGMGHLLYEEESFKESIKYWQQLIDLDTRNVYAHTCLGNCCRKLRNFQNGLEYYRRAFDLEPGNFYALFGLADCHRGLGDFRRSLEYWRRILAKEPKNRMILTRAGEACARLDRTDEAKEYFSDALEQGEDLYALIGMARIAKSDGEIVTAKEFYSRADGQSGSNTRFTQEIQSFLQNS